MDATRTIYRWTGVLAFLALPLLASGCAMLDHQGASGSLSDAGSAAASDARFTVEFHFDGDKRKPQVIEKPIAGTLHMQEALEQTGGLKKFRRCNLSLVRPLPGGMGHKMAVEYDRGTLHVKPEFDYAVLPGDRILVTEDPTGPLGEMLESRWLSPLNNLRSTKGRTSTGGYFRMGS